INTGFEDARNLGWKLAAVLQGWGGERLLESYSAERQPVFASTARDFIERAINDDRAFLETYTPDRDQAAFERAWTERNSGPATTAGERAPYAAPPILVRPDQSVTSSRHDPTPGPILDRATGRH